MSDKHLPATATEASTHSEHFIRQNFMLIAATLIASAVHYLYQFSMGRLLGPADYGALAALFSIIYIAVAPVQAVQLTLTKFVAEFSTAANLGAIKSLLYGVTKQIFFLSVLVFALFVVFSKYISEFLNIDSNLTIIQFSFVLLALFILAATRGLLQGLQKFKALGINLIAEAGIKLIIGLLLVFGGFGLAGAIWGTNISVFAAFGLGFVLLVYMLKGHSAAQIGHKEKIAIYKYSIPTLVALSTITALYSLDVLLVKHFFPPHEAGIYAAAALVSKVIFFALLPISQVMFPKVAELRAKKQSTQGIFLKSLALVVLLSAAAVAIYFAFPSLVLTFLFGPEYGAAIPLIGIFGAAISLLSISYLFINYFLSSDKIGLTYLLPVFVALEIGLIWFVHDSLLTVVLVLLALMAVMTLILGGIYIFTKTKDSSF